jgi:hypothetical protein
LHVLAPGAALPAEQPSAGNRLLQMLRANAAREEQQSDQQQQKQKQQQQQQQQPTRAQREKRAADAVEQPRQPPPPAAAPFTFDPACSMRWLQAAKPSVYSEFDQVGAGEGALLRARRTQRNATPRRRRRRGRCRL